MFTDFYIPTLSNDMKVAVQKKYLRGLILSKSLDHTKKRRNFGLNFTTKLFLSISERDIFFRNFRHFLRSVFLVFPLTGNL